MEETWLIVFVGLFLGLIVRNAYYTYRKVSKEGKKFEMSYLVTAIVTAIVSAAALMTGSEHIMIPEYMVEKGWWALVSMGFMIGVGGNDIVNNILKLAKKDSAETSKELENPPDGK